MLSLYFTFIRHKSLILFSFWRLCTGTQLCSHFLSFLWTLNHFKLSFYFHQSQLPFYFHKNLVVKHSGFVASMIYPFSLWYFLLIQNWTISSFLRVHSLTWVCIRYYKYLKWYFQGLTNLFSRLIWYFLSDCLVHCE